MKEISKRSLRLTHQGLLFVIGICTITLIALAYANNLALLFVFTLLATTIIATINGYKLIRHVEVNTIEILPGFAEQAIVAKVYIHNKTNENFPRVNIAFQEDIKKIDFFRYIVADRQELKETNLYKNDIAIIDVGVRPHRRGIYNIPECTIGLDYPMGLFEFYQHIRAQKMHIVYPRPGGNRPWPEHNYYSDEDGPINQGSGQDFCDHHLYQLGEPLSRINWKLYACRSQLMSKEFNNGADRAVMFTWQDTNGLETEARLSQLCQWLIEAYQKDIEFGVQLPRQGVKLGHGQKHLNVCLELLAKFDESRV